MELLLLSPIIIAAAGIIILFDLVIMGLVYTTSKLIWETFID